MRDSKSPGRATTRGPARLGLSHAALQAAVEAQLEEAGYDEDAVPLAEAVASAIDNNNQEILRQLRFLLAWEPAEGASSSTTAAEEEAF